VLTRAEMMELPCWLCWWNEGDCCFLEGRTTITEEDSEFGIVRTQAGTEITKELAEECNSYKSKRSVLEPYFGEKLVITSELAK